MTIQRQSATHGDFPQPVDPTAKVWRYFSLRRLVQVLKERALWFSRSDLLGDPCEGSRPSGDAVLFEAARQEVIARGDEKYLPSLRESWEKTDVQAKKDMFISCWQMQEPDMMGMWERYCRPIEAGVAIQTTYERLDRATPLIHPNGRPVMLGIITYGDYTNPGFRTNPANSFSAFMHKKHGYVDEHEVRLIIQLYQGQNVKGLSVPVEVDTLIEKIVVSPYALPGFEVGFAKAVQSLGCRVPVMRSSLHLNAVVY